MQHSHRPFQKSCGTSSNHDGSICLDSELWDMRFPFIGQGLQRRLQARRTARSVYSAAEADQSLSILGPHCRPKDLRQAASSHDGELQKCPIAAASVAVTAIRRATQNTAIQFHTTKIRIECGLPYRRKRRRLGRACQVCRMRAATNVSWPILRRL